MVKRERGTGQAMHTSFQEAIAGLRCPASMELATRLTTQTASGLACAKKNGVLAQYISFKSLHPHMVVLVRVGEFYETYGVDAVMLVEERVAEIHKSELRTSVSPRRLQRVLNALMDRGMCAVVYEESGVLCTPRRRVLSQVVTPAHPEYGIQEDTESQPPKPVMGILPHPSGAVTICSVYVQERLCRRLHEVGQEAASAILSHCMRPVYAFRSIPAWLKHEDTRLLGAAPNVDVADRLVEHVAREHSMSPCEFRVVAAAPSRCAPLSRFTLQQLGLCGDANVPNLCDFCLPRSAHSAVRLQLREWLSIPPARATVECNRLVLCTLLRADHALPEFKLSAGGRRQQQLREDRADIDALISIRDNASAMSHDAFRHIAEPLLASAAADMGYAPPTSSQVRGICECVDAFVRPAYAVTYRGDRAIRLNVHAEMLRAQLDALSAADAELTAALHGYIDAEVVRDARGVCLRGNPRGPDQLPVRDRANRIIPNQHTTPQLHSAEAALLHSVQALADEEVQAGRRCAARLKEQLPLVSTVESAALRLSLLVEHARLVAAKRWCLPVTGPAFRFDQLVPYWMDRNNAVVNCVTAEQGDIGVITAPNGGGKTTLLRAVGACVLLHQCGLAVPCSEATVPEVNSVFLRAGSSDSALERKSSFSLEMADIKAILTSGGSTVALIDEPCRGTSTVDGIALLSSILRHMPPNITLMLTTHYHELQQPDSPRVKRYQMGASVVGDDCVPDYKFREGTCTNSLALQVAMAVGIPLDIVKDARRADDVETLILLGLYRDNVQFVKLREGQRPPPSFVSVLYILDTVDGVYVGESDNYVERVRRHHAEKPLIRSAFVACCNNKSKARELETSLINELLYHNLPILSAHDGAHGL